MQTISRRLTRILLPAGVVSTLIFAALSLPVLVESSLRIVIQQEDQVAFDSSLEEIAPLYMGLAATLSLGLGLTGCVAAEGLRVRRRSSQLQKQLSEQSEIIKAQEEQLVQLRLQTLNNTPQGHELKAFLNGSKISPARRGS